MDNTTTPAGGTDIAIRIRGNGTQRFLTHKTLTTGEDGLVLFEWNWGSPEIPGRKIGS